MKKKNEKGRYAFIPAKTQSRRFPGKNMALLHGVPLLAHTIDFALSHGLSPLVFTDGEAVKRMAEWYGAEVFPQTPDQFEGYDAYLTALEAHPEVRVMVQLQCTNPFHKPGMLEEMVDRVEKGETASIYTSEEVKVNGHLAGDYRKAIGREEENTLHRYDGNLIVTTPDFFLAQGNYFLGQESSYLPNSFPFTWDIDYPEDLVFAEYIQSVYAPVNVEEEREKYHQFVEENGGEEMVNAREMEVRLKGKEESCRYMAIGEKNLLMPLSFVRGYTVLYVSSASDGVYTVSTVTGDAYRIEKGEDGVWNAESLHKKDGEKLEQVVEVSHPRWRRRLVLTHSIKRGYVFSGDEKFSILTFIPEKILRVKWDNWGVEEFLYRDGIYYKS